MGNIIGAKFNHLTILEKTKERSKQRDIIYRCLCDCGNETKNIYKNIRRGLVKSCGCLRKETATANAKLASQANLASGKTNADPRMATIKKVYRSRYSDGDITLELFFELSQKNCSYCNSPPANVANVYLDRSASVMPERLRDGYFIYNGLDRVDSSLPHNVSNVVPCCMTCNFAKSNKSLKSFLDWIKKVYEHTCYF